MGHRRGTLTSIGVRLFTVFGTPKLDVIEVHSFPGASVSLQTFGATNVEPDARCFDAMMAGGHAWRLDLAPDEARHLGNLLLAAADAPAVPMDGAS